MPLEYREEETMATSLEYIEFVCDQVRELGLGQVRYRKMFGEYMLYVNDKPLLLVCDNAVYIKLLPELAELMQGEETGLPYEGAKPHYVLDIDDREKTRAVVAALEPITPLPSSRKRCRRGTLPPEEP